MAGEDRTVPPALSSSGRTLADLLANPAAYSFFQALRLLRLSVPDAQALRSSVRVRPALSLAFPQSDLNRVELQDGHYQLEANFFGLYGVTSPLPTFYTEDLIDEAGLGGSASRDFLDILHGALYPLLFEAWEKYRLWLAVVEHQDTHRLEQLLALVGAMGVDAEAPFDPTLLISHAGNLSQTPASALGLQGLISGLLEGAPVQVEPCVVAEIEIPPEARACLGLGACTLGEDALIGERMRDRAGNARIIIGPLDAERYQSMLPGHPGHTLVSRVVERTLQTPLRLELHLLLEPGAGSPACLGMGWARLGHDTWLGGATDDAAKRADARFPLPVGAMRTARNHPHSSSLRSPVP